MMHDLCVTNGYRSYWVTRSKMRQDTDAGASKQHDGDCVVDLQVASILVDDDVAMLVGTERYCAATIGAFRLLLISRRLFFLPTG